MPKFQLSNLAKQDLEEIWIYTAKKWSIKQANIYYESLINECQFISENQKIGKSIKHIKPLHRIRQIQSHIVVYKIDKNQIWIDRFLHKRLDIETRLKP